MRQPGLFDLDERYRRLSETGDPLVRLAALIDFELFRPRLASALKRSDGSKGGRPPYDPVFMFKVLVLQTLYTLSDDATEFQIRDRLSFMRFLRLGLEGPVQDAKTIWLFREQLNRAGAIAELFADSTPGCRSQPLARTLGMLLCRVARTEAMLQKARAVFEQVDRDVDRADALSSPPKCRLCGTLPRLPSLTPSSED